MCRSGVVGSQFAHFRSRSVMRIQRARVPHHQRDADDHEQRDDKRGEESQVSGSQGADSVLPQELAQRLGVAHRNQTRPTAIRASVLQDAESATRLLNNQASSCQVFTTMSALYIV